MVVCSVLPVNMEFRGVSVESNVEQAQVPISNHGSSNFLAGKLPHLRFGVAKSIPRSGTKQVSFRDAMTEDCLSFSIILTDLPRLYACVNLSPPM